MICLAKYTRRGFSGVKQHITELIDPYYHKYMHYALYWAGSKRDHSILAVYPVTTVCL
jgi:hypothetical protein